MILSDNDIKKRLLVVKGIEDLPDLSVPRKEIVIVSDSFKVEQIQPASIDLRCYNNNGITLVPNQLLSIGTLEQVILPNDVCGLIKLKSSASRDWIDLFNGGWVDPGFNGVLTLNFKYNGNTVIKIDPYKSLVQLVLIQTKSASTGYKGKYQFAKQAETSKP